MIRSLWIARTGLDAQQTSLDVIANNLANVSTNGFKRARPVFQDLLYQTIRQPGAQSSQSTQISNGLQIGTGVLPVMTATIFNQGGSLSTGNQLDVEINGAGFLQVLLPDGTTAYTRDGSFAKDSVGQIVTSSGYPLQPPITIPGTGTVTIASTGEVSFSTTTPPISTTSLGTVQLATFVNNGGLQRIGENLFLETASSGTPSPNAPGANGAGTLIQGSVETSNVNVAEELVSMIATQRAYELNSKVISTSDAMLAKLTQL
ncbi:flagellar basal-body rod protein FlgG [Propionivibrio sp.]|uniref:flagellar basal-body rod protein FlgG n=1 Tax=Propionivibrio sp. TaxID=2212460 RepID=UPI003BF1687C